jgi:transposase-like protein
MIEQDHRRVKSHTAPMLSFKIFKCAAVMIAGIELLHRISKGQFDLGSLGVHGSKLRLPSGPRCCRLEN